MNRTLKELWKIVVLGILLYWGINNVPILTGAVGYILGLLSPFLIGGAMAFVFNIPMRSIEKLIAKQAPKLSKGALRGLSLVSTLLVIFIVFSALTSIVVPELVSTVGTLQTQVNSFVASDEVQEIMPQLESMLAEAGITTESIADMTMDFLTGFTSFASDIFGALSGVFSGIFNFVVAFVFSIYLLLGKEGLSEGVLKLLSAYLDDVRVKKTVYVSKLTSDTFAAFIAGQCLEGVILGVMTFIGMIVFKFPYALITSVLIAVTALIPIFGAFIGGAVGIFLILVVDPVKALWFIVFFVILQQVEGNVIYPKVVGGSIGLPPMLILAAVSIGGSMFGVAGMLIFIPLTSVGYTLLKQDINKRLS